MVGPCESSLVSRLARGLYNITFPYLCDFEAVSPLAVSS